MKYEKIQTLWKRDPDNKFVIMPGEHSKLEFSQVKEWVATEKVDGMNIRVIYNKDGIEFRGRTDNAQIHATLFKVLTEMFTVESLSQVFDLEKAETVILYGEGYGAGIQSGGKYRDDQSFILFDINIDGIWLMNEMVIEMAQLLNIEQVPILGLNWTIDDIVDFVKSQPESMIGKPKTVMEGVVCKSNPLMLDRMGRRIIWKLKIKDYEKLKTSQSK